MVVELLIRLMHHELQKQGEDFYHALLRYFELFLMECCRQIRVSDKDISLIDQAAKLKSTPRLERARNFVDIAADVMFGPAHNNLGYVYFKQKKYYLAAWEFQYAAKLMPNQAEPKNNLAMVLEIAGKPDQATEYYEQALKIQPDIEYGNEKIGYADLHAQRMSLSTAMAVHQLSPRVRQAHMRHTDPRLTDNTYMDETLLPVADELFNMPWIPEPDTKIPESIHLKKTGADAVLKTGSSGSVLAPNMHQTVGSKGQKPASAGKMKDSA